jgi:hypothetical protein
MKDIFGFEAKQRELKLKETLAIRIARWRKLKRWVHERLTSAIDMKEVLDKMEELEKELK